MTKKKTATEKKKVSEAGVRKNKEALLARAKKRASYSPKFKKIAAKLEAELNPKQEK